MDFEQIEDEYGRELEIAENDFIESLKKGGERKSLEEKYRKRVQQARARFYEKTEKRIRNPDKPLRKKSPKEEKVKPLDVRRTNFKLGFFTRLRYKWKLWRFKIGFWMHNKLKNNTPEIVSYSYIKTRADTRRAKNKVRNFFGKIFSSIREFFVWIYGSIGEGLKKFFEWFSKLPEKFFGLFSKKKKEEPAGGKKESADGGKESNSSQSK